MPENVIPVIEYIPDYGGMWRLILPWGKPRHYRTESAAKCAATRLIKAQPAKVERAAAKAAWDAECREKLARYEERERLRKEFIADQLRKGAHMADISAYLARQRNA